MKRSAYLLVAVVLTLLPATHLRAQNHHPEYQHAMANLDAAGSLLKTISKPSAASDLQAADKEIWDAYNELMKAGKLDKKDMPHDYAPDTAVEKGGPLHKVRDLVQEAHKETSHPEDDQAAQSLQQSAMRHMDAAIKDLDAAISAPGEATVGSAPEPPGNHSPAPFSGPQPSPEPGEPGGHQPGGHPSGSNDGNRLHEHPAYLHALVDLRAARAHIEHDTRGGLGAEEQEAIKEIDSTIGRIHQAALDDGKDLSDHPPIDPKLDRSGLLHKALALLQRTKTDISEHESDEFANGLRKQAIGFLDEAIHHLNAALNVTEGK
jgi:tetratricopeptide (TPR) repeat protein